VTIPASGHMRAVFDGDSARAPLISPPRRITVLARMNLRISRNRVGLGTRFTAAGTASPADTVSLTLERRYRRRWVPERRRTLPVLDGAYRARLRPRRRGKYRVTVRVGPVARHRQLKVF
jgi:hypothetical protein